MVDRVLTGIEGLDKLLNGGLVKKRHVILCGGPGTGKTSFAYEYLYKGAELYDDKGLFLSLEQSPERVVEGAKTLLKWDWDKHLDKNILFTRIVRDDFDSIIKVVEGYVKDHDVSRVVVDSLTLLKLYFRSDDAYRNHLFELLDFLGNLDCTTILTSEQSSNRREEARYGIEQFVGDGVINLYLVPKENDRLRVLEILKMRDTDHSSRLVPFKLTNDGIMISAEAHLFTDVK
jgi:KaiC/GvpD/RAD55 family RecA-like ATPase